MPDELAQPKHVEQVSQFVTPDLTLPHRAGPVTPRRRGYDEVCVAQIGPDRSSSRSGWTESRRGRSAAW
jgi:hypothetical protein